MMSDQWDAEIVEIRERHEHFCELDKPWIKQSCGCAVCCYVYDIPALLDALTQCKREIERLRSDVEIKAHHYHVQALLNEEQDKQIANLQAQLLTVTNELAAERKRLGMLLQPPNVLSRPEGQDR